MCWAYYQNVTTISAYFIITSNNQFYKQLLLLKKYPIKKYNWKMIDGIPVNAIKS